MSQNPDKLHKALRYSGIGFQITGTFALGFFIGYKLDNWLSLPKPYLTALFAVIFLIAGLYLGLKDFLKSN